MGRRKFCSLTISVVSAGGVVTEIVSNTATSYSAYPNAPNIGDSPSVADQAGYGHYNAFDMTQNLAHTAGMTVAYNAEPWWSRTYSLAAFAGQTVTLRIATNNTQLYRTWFHIDDVEWSMVAGTPGAAEAFGVALASPSGTIYAGQTIRVLATVDARPTDAGSPVLADILLPGGSPYLSGIVLYNDGAHGDGGASDAVWSSAAITIPLNTMISDGWQVRVYARDASTSTLGSASNGMVHRDGLGTPLALSNWWNIDEATFAVRGTLIGISKTMTILSDGVNSAIFKAIPGARLRYCITIANNGSAAAGAIEGSDELPADLTYEPGTLRSGADCNSAATIEDDDSTGADESDPVGASIAGRTVTFDHTELNASNAFAITFEAILH